MKIGSVIFCSIMMMAMQLSNGQTQGDVKVGSKQFTESLILAEIMRVSPTQRGLSSTRHDLGGTRVLWAALLKGSIDAYPEYTGTLSMEILGYKQGATFEELEKVLATKGIGIVRPFGFNNTYAIGVTEKYATAQQLEKISDLRKVPNAELAFSHEFIDRTDGWKALQKRYNLPQVNVRGLDHDIAYRTLNEGQIAATDLYSTDAEIEYYKLKVLKDDLLFFPEYQAVILYRMDFGKKHPEIIEDWNQFAGKIDESLMSLMNADVKVRKISEVEVARGFVGWVGGSESVVRDTVWTRFFKNLKDHLTLVFVSLSLAIVIAVPLGIICAKFDRVGHVVFAGVGIVQVIPALALLVLMLPFFGIGRTPAIAALFLYSLLPIIRNTATGIKSIEASLSESADSLGLSWWQKLRLIEFPLALPSVITGIKISAVINVGTATLGAIIGAGGFGQPILTGIRLDDLRIILEGAVPAAGLAVIVDLIFTGLEKTIHLRIRR